jgi:hypothetical protein
MVNLVQRCFRNIRVDCWFTRCESVKYCERIMLLHLFETDLNRTELVLQ